MADSQPFCVAEERSGHCAVVDGNFLYVWGGYVGLSAAKICLRHEWKERKWEAKKKTQDIMRKSRILPFYSDPSEQKIAKRPWNLESIEDNEVYLPNDEIWTYEIDSGLWTMHLMEGELPTSMSGSCGACINGKLYVFGGYDDKGYSNRLYFVNLRTRDGTYIWEKITSFEGQPPTPRDKLSCWVYKDRLIYFGGYGCRRHNELQDCFDVHDASWEEQIFWGWHNDVHVFDTKTQNWFQPEIKGGAPPQPRAAHTCAVLGNKGYIFGGRVLQTRMNDLHCLNLDAWTWSGRIPVNGENPKHRSWHTLTPIADDKLFLFGGLSADNIPLSDGWIYNVITNGWKQLTHLPKTRPRYHLSADSAPTVPLTVFLCWAFYSHDLFIHNWKPVSPTPLHHFARPPPLPFPLSIMFVLCIHRSDFAFYLFVLFL